MPIMVVYSGSGVAPQAYAPYETELLKTPVPPEGLVHQVAIDGDDFMVVDIWSSREAFERWTEGYIKPSLKRHGLPYAEPRVYEVLALAAQDRLDAFSKLKVRAPQPA